MRALVKGIALLVAIGFGLTFVAFLHGFALSEGLDPTLVIVGVALVVALGFVLRALWRNRAQDAPRRLEPRP